MTVSTLNTFGSTRTTNKVQPKGPHSYNEISRNFTTIKNKINHNTTNSKHNNNEDELKDISKEKTNMKRQQKAEINPGAAIIPVTEDKDIALPSYNNPPQAVL